MADAPLRLVHCGGLAYLQLCNPPANVMNNLFFERFSAIVATLGSLPVEGLVIHGTGRHFSSGADVGELIRAVAGTPADAMAQAFTRNHRAFEALAALPYPVVAAVCGCCIGAGLELALACRYRIAAERAVFSLPETSFGLIPGCGGTVRLPSVVGRSKAIELILSGRTVLADEAAEIGLIDRLVPRGELIASAEQLIGSLRKRGKNP